MYIWKDRKLHQYPLSAIYACDETAVWLDPSGATTVDLKGQKEVGIKTMGNEKLNIMALCAKADGSKCLPYVLVRRKRPIPEILQTFQGKLVINWAGKIWMDNELAIDFP